MSLGYPAIEAAGAQPHEVQLYGTTSDSLQQMLADTFATD